MNFDQNSRGSAQGQEILKLLILVLFFAVQTLMRFEGVRARYPYLNYADEGHSVHQMLNMFKFSAVSPNWHPYNPLVMSWGNRLVKQFVNFKKGPDAAWQFHNEVRTWRDGRVNNFSIPEADFKIKYNPNTYYDIIQPPVFLLAGRVVIAGLGLLSLVFVFLLLRWVLPFWPAFFALLAYSLLPMFVTHNYFLVQDMGITAAASLLYAAMMFWFRSRRHIWLWGAAIAVGMALGFKITSLVFLSFPVLVILFCADSWWDRIKFSAIIVGGSLIAFYLLCPGVLGKEAGVFGVIFSGSTEYNLEKYVQTQRYFWRLLDHQQFGWSLFLGALVGAVLALLRSKAERPFFLGVVGFLVVYYSFFSLFANQQARYMLPTFPLFFLLLAAMVNSLATLSFFSKRKKLGQITMSILILVLSLPTTMLGVRAHSNYVKAPDTRNLAMVWLSQYAPKRSKVCVMEEIPIAPTTLAHLSQKHQLLIEEFSLQDFSFDECSFVVVAVLGDQYTWPKEKLAYQRMIDLINDTEGLEPVITFGNRMTNPRPNLYKYNNQMLRIYSRKDQVRRN